MIGTRLYHLLVTAILQSLLVSADYDCTCNYNVEAGVYKTTDGTGTPLGYMYEFDCKPIYGPKQNGYSEIQYEHQIGYVKLGDQVTTQMCQGDIPDADKVTITAAPTTATTATTPVSTASTTTTTTTPKTATPTTTPAPTTITTTITPAPTTSTTTTTTTTTTTKTTPAPTTTTTTPRPTTTSTAAPTTTVAKMPEGHVELCPNTTRTDIGFTGGYLGQYGEYCYEYIPLTTQWANAERHCKIVSNGHLASITNAGEQDYLLRFLQSHSHTDPVWIGLSDSDVEGTWKWSSGQPVTYKHFQTTFSWHTDHEHKMKDCVVLQSNGEWVDFPCGVYLVLGTGFGEKHSYVCQYNLTSKPISIFNGILGTFIVG